MDKRVLFILLLLFFLSVVSVSAGDNTTHYSDIVNESRKDISKDTVIALEDGHFNTSFSDGSNGYCLEYGEEEAVKGDVFYKVDTSYYSSANSIKQYFVDYTSHALSDKVVCQHMIWHFTDGFDGWRLNYTIINELKNNPKIIGDTYVQRLNGTHERVWFFHVSLSPFEHRQDYFNYRFMDRLIIYNDGNVSCNGTSNNIINNTDKENNTNQENTTNNKEVIKDNKTIKKDQYKKTDKPILNKSKIKKYNTGHPIRALLLLTFLLILIIIDKKEEKEK